jgi:hypothetical protein
MNPITGILRTTNFTDHVTLRNLWVICISLIIGSTLLATEVRCRQADGVVPNTVTLDTLFSIGGSDGPLDELIFRPQNGQGRPLFDRGPDGLLWILNPGDQVLMIFDENGQKQRAYGRDGSGPGEFRAVLGLTAVEGGAWTWDWRNQQLCRWSLDEGLISTRRTQIPQPLMNTVAISESGTIWFMNEVLEEPALELVPVHLYCTDEEGAPVDMHTYEVPGVVYPRQAGAFSFVPELAPAPGGGIIIAPTCRFDLHFYRQGSAEPVNVWTLPSIENPYTRQQLQPGGRGGIGIPPDIDKLIEPPLLPHQADIESMHRVNSEEIWVGTSVRGGGRMTRYDRLDLEGNRIDSIWLPGWNSAIRYDGTSIYVLTMNWDGYQVHKIRVH